MLFSRSLNPKQRIPLFKPLTSAADNALPHTFGEHVHIICLTKSCAIAQDIDVLCTECSNLIDNHEKIQVLSAVHYNLGKTLQDVVNIVNLPQEAAEAENMLRDDVQLLQVALSKMHALASACFSVWSIALLYLHLS